MSKNRVTAVLLGMALLLAGCSFLDNALLPSMSGSSGGTHTSTKPAAAAAAAKPATPAPAPGTGVASGRPLVVIRFNQPNPDYEQPLSQVVSEALARRPNAMFDLVAVSPQTSDTAKAALSSTTAHSDADQVMHSLLNMGLTADRIAMSSTTSATAQSIEVHLYVH
jgi:hypothetical protein